ncbi:LOW QUALITY PROTEIN: hypothetical protein MKX08_002793 [Trichoderma sp. CBMAI-0020]|nr:LOW QUALITY PROTEIN: hypothetical protein MKX08_002793 [Trichoderma sp. CBMAI-0020]
MAQADESSGWEPNSGSSVRSRKASTRAFIDSAVSESGARPRESPNLRPSSPPKSFSRSSANSTTGMSHAPLLGRNGLGRLDGALQVGRVDELERLRPLGEVRGQAADLQRAVRRQARVARSGVDARHVVDRLAMADQQEEHLLRWARTGNEQRWSELRVMEAKTVLRVPCGRKAQTDWRFVRDGQHGGGWDWEEEKEETRAKSFPFIVTGVGASD